MRLERNDLRWMRAPISLPYRAITQAARVQFPVLKATMRLARQLTRRCEELDGMGRCTGLQRLEKAVLRWLTGARDSAQCTTALSARPDRGQTIVSIAGWASLQGSEALRTFSFAEEEETGAETGVQGAEGQALDPRMTRDQAVRHTGHAVQQHNEARFSPLSSGDSPDANTDAGA